MRCRIGETNIICTDLQRSLHFYRDLLGFEAIKEEGPAWHLACDGRKFLLLAVARQGREPLPYCEVAEISLDVIVDDLSEAKIQCEAGGVRFVSEFKPSPDRFFIHDPDGLVIEVIQSAREGAADE